MSLLVKYTASGREYFMDGVQVSEDDYQKVNASRFQDNLQGIFKTGLAPYGSTDKTFLAGHCNGNQFEKTPTQGDAYRKEAVSRGVNIKGKVYRSSLAAFPGDPRAWVSTRGEARKLLEERGWSSEGAVKVKGRELLNPPRPGPVVADELLNDEVEKIIEAMPDRARVDRTDLKNQVLEKRSPKRKRKA